jgi:hypothetical protein
MPQGPKARQLLQPGDARDIYIRVKFTRDLSFARQLAGNTSSDSPWTGTRPKLKASARNGYVIRMPEEVQVGRAGTEGNSGGSRRPRPSRPDAIDRSRICVRSRLRSHDRAIQVLWAANEAICLVEGLASAVAIHWSANPRHLCS